MTPRVGARPSMRYSPKIACSTSPRACIVAATRSIASPARSGLLTLTFDISPLPSPRNWAMAGESDGYRAALVRRPLTPGLISSLLGTAGSPPFISFSTSYPEQDSAQPEASPRLLRRTDIAFTASHPFQPSLPSVRQPAAEPLKTDAIVFLADGAGWFNPRPRFSPPIRDTAWRPWSRARGCG